MSEQLKPCPFCGGEAYIRICAKIQYIDCKHTKKCIVKPDTWLISNKSMKRQIKGWNRRIENA